MADDEPGGGTRQRGGCGARDGLRAVGGPGVHARDVSREDERVGASALVDRESHVSGPRRPHEFQARVDAREEALMLMMALSFTLVLAFQAHLDRQAHWGPSGFGK